MVKTKDKKQFYLNVAETINTDCDRDSIKYKDQLSNEEILSITPMTFIEEIVAILLFVFGVPGAAYSVRMMLLNNMSYCI